LVGLAVGVDAFGSRSASAAVAAVSSSASDMADVAVIRLRREGK
jgi:hypothetical protein